MSSVRCRSPSAGWLEPVGHHSEYAGAGGRHPPAPVDGIRTAGTTAPWLVAGNPAIIQPGMVLAVEVGAFRDDDVYVGAMPEDLVLVTETGTENLTAHRSNDRYIAH